MRAPISKGYLVNFSFPARVTFARDYRIPHTRMWGRVSRPTAMAFTYICNNVNGILRLPCVTKESMDELHAGFEALDGDVVVATYPKSGTTWMQQILKLIKNGGVDDRSKSTRFTWVEVNGLQALKVIYSIKVMKNNIQF